MVGPLLQERPIVVTSILSSLLHYTPHTVLQTQLIQQSICLHLHKVQVQIDAAGSTRSEV
ncbi:hypothetical protein CROQUDRAFT_667074, partial [Cronartium quercuum f. sp. fusiforme G11]